MLIYKGHMIEVQACIVSSSYALTGYYCYYCVKRVGNSGKLYESVGLLLVVVGNF